MILILTEKRNFLYLNTNNVAHKIVFLILVCRYKFRYLKIISANRLVDVDNIKSIAAFRILE